MSESNPYLNARREWDERYGDALARARSWRIAALAAIGATAVAAAGIAWIGSQSKIRPYVVQIDQIGSPVAVAQPTAAGAVTQRIAEALVANWVWDARTSLHDTAAQKVLVDRVYAMAGDVAAQYLTTWYAQHPPFGDFSTAVTVTSVLPMSANSYQVTWEEVRTGPDGQPQPAEHWKADVTTGVDPKFAESARVAVTSPLGLYVKAVTWTRVFSGT